MRFSKNVLIIPVALYTSGILSGCNKTTTTLPTTTTSTTTTSTTTTGAPVPVNPRPDVKVTIHSDTIPSGPEIVNLASTKTTEITATETETIAVDVNPLPPKENSLIEITSVDVKPIMEEFELTEETIDTSSESSASLTQPEQPQNSGIQSLRVRAQNQVNARIQSRINATPEELESVFGLSATEAVAEIIATRRDAAAALLRPFQVQISRIPSDDFCLSEVMNPVVIGKSVCIAQLVAQYTTADDVLETVRSAIRKFEPELSAIEVDNLARALIGDNSKEKFGNVMEEFQVAVGRAEHNRKFVELKNQIEGLRPNADAQLNRETFKNVIAELERADIPAELRRFHANSEARRLRQAHNNVLAELLANQQFANDLETSLGIPKAFTTFRRGMSGEDIYIDFLKASRINPRLVDANREAANAAFAGRHDDGIEGNNIGLRRFQAQFAPGSQEFVTLGRIIDAPVLNFRGLFA